MSSRACRSDQPSYSAKSTPAEGARILVVEDDDAFADLLERSLAARTYRVARARGVPQAHELLTRIPFDVVLTDVHLGGSSGLEIAFSPDARIRAIPLVVMTAYPTRELEWIVEGSGVTFLTKPFVMDALLARILGLVIERRAELEPRPDAPNP